jgi:hypothetical protein
MRVISRWELSGYGLGLRTELDEDFGHMEEEQLEDGDNRAKIPGWYWQGTLIDFVGSWRQGRSTIEVLKSLVLVGWDWLVWIQTTSLLTLPLFRIHLD